jgi:hypothetical protein
MVRLHREMDDPEPALARPRKRVQQGAESHLRSQGRYLPPRPHGDMHRMARIVRRPPPVRRTPPPRHQFSPRTPPSPTPGGRCGQRELGRHDELVGSGAWKLLGRGAAGIFSRSCRRNASQAPGPSGIAAQSSRMSGGRPAGHSRAVIPRGHSIGGTSIGQ